MSEIIEHLKTDRELQALANALAMLLLNGRWGRDDVIALLDHAIAEVRKIMDAMAAEADAAGPRQRRRNTRRTPPQRRSSTA